MGKKWFYRVIWTSLFGWNLLSSSLAYPCLLNIPHEQEAAKNLLSSEDYQALFRFWDRLSDEEKQSLVSQINQIDLTALAAQKALLQHSNTCQRPTYEPYLDYAYSGHAQDRENGKRRIEAGELGCLILAGGQGSRLGFAGPKGLYPVSVIKNKTLFQLFAEKVLAASKQANRPLLLAIMTSPDNDQETRQFFEKHQYFGLQSNQVFFFCQKTLPLLDKEGHLMLESPSQIAVGPNGNGLCLYEFVQSGIWQDWNARGIKYLHLIVIDNPLADPYDPELLGFHCRQGVEVTMKCTEKQKPEEKLGILIKQDQKCRVIEYSEMPEAEKGALAEDGRLKYRCGNLSLFCFSMDFVEKAGQHADMPLHLAWKAVKCVDKDGTTQRAEQPNAWKFETFVFDVLDYADKTAALLYPRKECFSPLKNKSGENSIATVQQDLQHRDRQIIEEITGLQAPDFPFELALDFYYPTAALYKAWEFRRVTTSYVEP